MKAGSKVQPHSDLEAAAGPADAPRTPRTKRRASVVAPHAPVQPSSASETISSRAYASRDESRELPELEAPSGLFHWRPTPILPKGKHYLNFWLITVITALLNAIIEPYKIAFTGADAFKAGNEFFIVMEVFGTLVFFVDIVLKFFVTYPVASGNHMVLDLRKISARYLRGMFLLDVLFMVPWVPIILAANPGLQEEGSTAGMYVTLLGLLKLGRLYNVSAFFTHMDQSMVISQVQLMLLRNLTYILLSCHIFACIFYFAARASGFADNSWVGGAFSARFDDQPVYVLYMNAMYVSIVTFSGLGDGTLYAHNPAESLLMSIFCLLNVFVAAYILGTVTMLMVKADEKSGIFRGHMSLLRQYSTIHQLPNELEVGMQQHLELHYLGNQTDTSDEKLLSTYPPAIKRKVLRHLYEAPIRQCYLFSNLKPKFLDAILASCRTDLFLPDVQLIAEGDIVSDLYMLVEGRVDVVVGSDTSGSHNGGGGASVGGGSMFGRQASDLRSPTGLDASSHNRRASVMMGKGRSRRASSLSLGTSDCLGAVAFFTETPSTEAVWTLTVVKVLMISRNLYDALQNSHPRQVQTILSNLKNKHDKELLDLLNMELLNMDIDNPIFKQLQPYMDGCILATTELPSLVMMELKDALPPGKAARIDKLIALKLLMNTYFTRKVQHQMIELLDAASKGDDETMRKLLASGTSPNKGDYDKRTALMVSAQEGKENVVKMLLEAGAEVNALDIFGTNALVGAVKAGHGKAIDVLLAHGASLDECTPVVRSDVIDSILQGDMARLARYLEAGTDPNLADHNGSTLMHVSASEGNVSAVKVLLAAGADVLLADRWGDRALDDARRAEATPVVRLLEPLVAHAKKARMAGSGNMHFSLQNRHGEGLTLVETSEADADGTRLRETMHRLRSTSPVVMVIDGSNGLSRALQSVDSRGKSKDPAFKRYSLLGDRPLRTPEPRPGGATGMTPEPASVKKAALGAAPASPGRSSPLTPAAADAASFSTEGDASTTVLRLGEHEVDHRPRARTKSVRTIKEESPGPPPGPSVSASPPSFAPLLYPGDDDDGTPRLKPEFQPLQYPDYPDDDEEQLQQEEPDFKIQTRTPHPNAPVEFTPLVYPTVGELGPADKSVHVRPPPSPSRSPASPLRPGPAAAAGPPSPPAAAPVPEAGPSGVQSKRFLGPAGASSQVMRRASATTSSQGPRGSGGGAEARRSRSPMSRALAQLVRSATLEPPPGDDDAELNHHDDLLETELLEPPAPGPSPLAPVAEV